MPRTNIPIQSLPDAEAAISWTNVVIADDAEFLNDGSTILLLRNPDAAQTLDVTIISVSCSHGRTGDIVKAVATETLLHIFRKLPKDDFNQANGKVNVDFAGTAAGAQMAALRV